MKNLKITKQVHVDCNLTVKQWQLFEMPEVEGAAMMLNISVQNAVNAQLTRKEARKAIETTQEVWQEYGAYDSEPSQVIEDILDLVYS